jgi:DNA-binding LacI/PurR family transcriptional regulator
MHEKPTSFDIAFLAGVSQPTVSRALRGSPMVSLETRKRIEEIARQLNYRVDKNASNLRSQHSNTLALLLFEDPTPDDSQINPFFLSMLGSITRASARQGYDLLISFQQLSKDWQQDYEDSRKADGIILLGYGDFLEYRLRLEQLVHQGTHFVRWGAVMEGQPGLSVGCDNFHGGQEAAQHLLRLGRRNIAFLGSASGHYPEFLERYRGYSEALQAAGAPVSAALQVDAITMEQ